MKNAYTTALSEMKAERARLDRAITALEAMTGDKPKKIVGVAKVLTPKKRRTRAHISDDAKTVCYHEMAAALRKSTKAAELAARFGCNVNTIAFRWRTWAPVAPTQGFNGHGESIDPVSVQ